MSDQPAPPDGTDPPDRLEPPDELPAAGEPSEATPVDTVEVERPPRSRWATTRSAAGALLLGLLAFAATAILLVGILSLGNRPSGTRGTGAAPSPNAAAKTADFDVIAATLDRVQAAAAQGDWGRAEQARLEA